jgi:methoxymalonate biosynthesis protein
VIAMQAQALRGAIAEAAPVATVKCLVWDLDETLWRGTLLEHDELQPRPGVLDVVRGLDARGILQSVASRNDHDDAWARLERFGAAEYFVLPHIGWGRKSDAIRSIAEHLSFARSTIGFIDDQPAERAEVAFELPEVRCYEAAQAAGLLDLPEFRTPTVTVDARRRREMYQAGFRRDAARTQFSGPDEDFLRSLEMVVRIARAGEQELSRVEELTVRTSQMNATGVHYSDAALRALLSDPGHEVLVLTLTDRFGPHGAVGVMLLERRPCVWHLKLLATSCRVVSFGAGAILLQWLTDRAAAAGVHLVADFRPTDRNRIMEITYRFAGFTEDACTCRAALAASTDPAVQALPLVPDPQPAPSTMTVFGPDLAVPARAAGMHDGGMRWA